LQLRTLAVDDDAIEIKDQRFDHLFCTGIKVWQRRMQKWRIDNGECKNER
jgi:hypothetical protein